MKRTVEYITIEDDVEEITITGNKRHKPEEDIIDLNDVPATEIVPRPQSIKDRHGWMSYMRRNCAIGYSGVASAGRGAFTSVDLPAGVYLGHHESDDWLRYINGAGAKENENVRIAPTGHFVTLRPISAWSELFVGRSRKSK